MMAACLLPLLMLPGVAQAVSCSGWGSATDMTVYLGVPASVTLTDSNSSTGSVLASGTANVTPLLCQDPTGTSVKSGLSWGSSSSAYDSTTRRIAPGIGLQLTWTSPDGRSGSLSPASSTPTSGVDSDGLYWSQLAWKLIRLPDTAMTGTWQGANLVNVFMDDTSVSTGTRTLHLYTGTGSVTLTAVCALSVDKPLVTLPDTDADDLMRDGHSASVALSAAVTCPAGTTLSNGTTITMATPLADATDNTLVGSTGTAKGVAIEVLDGSGKRVSAQNGTVSQGAFTQNGTASPGVTQGYSVRMALLPGHIVTPGSVQGSFTLTVSVN